MTKEAKLELLERFLETRDKEESVKLGLQLFPGMTRKELEDKFDLAMALRTGRELTPEEQKMLDEAKDDAHNHFLKLCDDMANERQR